jgi:hypothetical protein
MLQEVKNKYYQPDISELYVGYECECNPQPKSNPNLWRLFTIDNSEFLKRIIEYPESAKTKYLDSDDIVSLGFEETTLSEYKKGDLYIVLYSDNKILIQNEGETVYYGACKSKNELKKILEWIK